LRPGGTISGAAMFAVCDAALFVAILGEVGRVANAVTTSASINFLRRPEPADLIGKARLIKLGKRLAVGEVALYSEGESEMVAHATGTYSIPVRGEAVRP
jgi:acyl-coenzyme A thioesterase PaaI-like protein